MKTRRMGPHNKTYNTRTNPKGPKKKQRQGKTKPHPKLRKPIVNGVVGEMCVSVVINVKKEPDLIHTPGL